MVTPSLLKAKRKSWVFLTAESSVDWKRLTESRCDDDESEVRCGDDVCEGGASAFALFSGRGGAASVHRLLN